MTKTPRTPAVGGGIAAAEIFRVAGAPAAWLLLSVLSARPFRAAAMPDRDRLEDGVAAIALQALVAPIPAPPSTGNEDHHRAHHE